MSVTTRELKEKHCVACESGVPALEAKAAREYLQAVPGWQITEDGKAIRRDWQVKDFVTGIDFFDRVARVAEEEDHHPDLHLTGYRKVRIEISTHAIGGLSENDFILAARINDLPVELKK